MKGAPPSLTVDTETGRVGKERRGEIDIHVHGAEREDQDTIDGDHMIEVGGAEVDPVIGEDGEEVGHVIEKGGITHGDLVPDLETGLGLILEGDGGGLKERKKKRRDHHNRLC